MIAAFRRILHDKMTPDRAGIKTFWWRRMGLISDQPNLGDELTPAIVDEMTAHTCTWAHPKRSELIGAGSILEMVQVAGARPGLKVWGSGFIQSAADSKRRNFDHPDFDFHAVRGRLTLDRIRSSREVVLGDPGLLASRVFPRQPAVDGRIGLVYHYVHRRDPVVRALSESGAVTLIDPLRPPAEVVADITGCEFIFSTSLHGLIVADSFGIPNAWVTLPKQLHGGEYKFEDYYSAFGEAPTLYPADIIGDSHAVATIARNYRGINGLDEIQDRLIDAFPCASPGR